MKSIKKSLIKSSKSGLKRLKGINETYNLYLEWANNQYIGQKLNG